MKQNFDTVLNNLKEDVAAFARKYPQHANALSLDTFDYPDPNIERRLEGAAYLTGKVQHQIDTGMDHVVQNF